MCGIAGIVHRHPHADLGRTLQRMGNLLAHRGPDGEGFAVALDGKFVVAADGSKLPAAKIGLAHRRLSIIDLTAAAQQPMCDDSGRRALCYNGEIYNYLELRSAELDGHSIRSNGDTEVLLRLMCAKGSGILDRLIGMFAFAYVDLERDKLLLVRDAFGIKPLYYLSEVGRFAFASEIKPLLALIERQPQVDPRCLHRYLRHAFTDCDELTFFSGIRQVCPGEAIEVDLNDPARFRKFTWWLPPTGITGKIGGREAAEELRALFLESVRLHLRADIPVATTLSGGIDSSGIVAGVRSAVGRSAQVDAFTYRADDPALDESRYAAVAASAAHAVRHDVDCGAELFTDRLDELLLLQEQPITTMSIMAQHAVFSDVRRAGFKVAVDGQGSDELFAGYPVFRAARLAELFRTGQLAKGFAFLRGAGMGVPVFAGATLRLLPRALALPVGRSFGRSGVPTWGNRDWFKRHVGPAVDESQMRGSLREELADAMWRTSLPMLLRYADRNAMASSVENRVPFLTPALARFAARISTDSLIDQQGTTKRILRDALRGMVPDAILDRADKIGFQAPESQWLARSERLRSRLLSFLPTNLPVFFAPNFRLQAENMLQGGRFDPAIWRGLSVLRWCQLFNVEVPA
jgi:asparagine synthase (glutamine-hydrolysing)